MQQVHVSVNLLNFTFFLLYYYNCRAKILKYYESTAEFKQITNEIIH